MSRRASWSFLVIAAAIISGCGAKTAAPPAPDVWATVDGREIRRDDVDKAYRRIAQAPATSDDEMAAAKLSVLNDLITQNIMLARAKAMNIDVSSSELDAAFADRKKAVTEDAFQKELTQRGLTTADMKEGLRLELLTQKFLEKEVSSKISVTEQDIAAFYDANRAQFNMAENSFHIAQIVVTPVKDQQITNRLSDDATSPAAADKKAQMLMSKLQAGTRFSELAMDYSEDPQTTPQGGDLGFVTMSQLSQVAPPLRDAVLKAAPGTVADVSAGGGHTLVLLIEKEAAGQRDLGSPGVRENIGNGLRQRKEQLLRVAYLTSARDDAKIVNYFARQLAQSPGKVPAGLLQGPPGK